LTTQNSVQKLAPQLDVRCDGGYVIAPPSVHHETGKPYRVIKDLRWAPVPADLLNPPKPTTTQALATADTIPKGRRHQELLSFAGGMRARGLTADKILVLLRITNRKLCVPPLEESDVRRIANDIGRKPGGFPGNRSAESSAEVELQYYRAVERERVKWLWPGRIPAGKLTLFVGDPGTGKSLITLDVAARLSTGRSFPDGVPCERGNILILTAEDDARDTVGPRLDAAGADSSRIARVNAVKVTLADGSPAESAFNLERDLAKLEEALREHQDFKLIIVDPLTAYMGTKLNSWRDSEVRALLTPVTDFAARTGIAVGGIMHMRKSETDAMLRVSGSIAFVAAARAVWGFGVDPDDETQRVMVGVKCNLAALGNALAYKITANTDGAPHIVWQKEPRTLDAEDVLGGSKKEKRDRAEKVGEAEEWLRNRLGAAPVAQEQLKTEAENKGISWRTLRRAKDHLSVKSHKAGFARGWFWELPQDAQGDQH
jgi:putative DNA primase/helicase